MPSAFLFRASTLTVFALSGACAFGASASGASSKVPLDRQALVSRHSPRLDHIDPWAPLTVGNGRFAFTADVTGLQSLGDDYQRDGIPLETQARWAWHSEPNPAGYTLADASRPFLDRGEMRPYPNKGSGPAALWLRRNPHIQPLPRLAFVHGDGRALVAGEVRDVSETLDLWTGTLSASFTLDGKTVRTTVAVHPERDVLAVRAESPLFAEGKLAVKLSLPRGHDLERKLRPALDWSEPESHITRMVSRDEHGLVLEHRRDESRYHVALRSDGALSCEDEAPHGFTLRPISGSGDGGRLALAIVFSETAPERAYSAAEVFAASAEHWPRFWRSGGAVDFSGSTDPRASELERRVVLSQYLTAVNFGGDFPPQESGLTNSSWYGKHHTEMIWWHAAHFALWGREERLAGLLDWYVRSLPGARELARSRGLEGTRWAKMIGPDGRESPGGNPFIVWNQPHPVHLAELVYRNRPTAETLTRYRNLVQETAEAMSSMLHWNEARQRYDLGPPLWIAQEIHEQAESANPTYELSYWRRGLEIAQQWRERLGLARDPEWDRRIRGLAPLPVKDGKYVALESIPDTWDNAASRHDHPSFLMALGQLPGDGVDRETMSRTLDAVLASWDWETKIWGWDYPMIAMTAARLGRPRDAVDALMFTRGPNNAYTAAGHCPQRDDIPVYLPANGALLAAVAMMAGGWDGAPTGRNAPGFPDDGTWTVRWEGLRPLP